MEDCSLKVAPCGRVLMEMVSNVAGTLYIA